MEVSIRQANLVQGIIHKGLRAKEAEQPKERFLGKKIVKQGKC